MALVYLLSLLLALSAMVLLDRRFELFFFADARRAGLVLVIGVLFFLAWDIGGIGLDIFHRGETRIMLGLVLAPHLPIEEVFFLAFLCYVTMVVCGLAARLLRGSRPGQQG